MKYGVDKGHNCPYDTGANDVMFEDNITKEVGNKVIDKLRQLGNTVIDVTPSAAESTIDSLSKRVMKANQNNVDVYVSIHANAGGGHGSEVYAVSDKGRALANPVLNELVNLGYTNRGIKSANLYVLNHTNAPAILVELFFVDSSEDCSKYNSEALANAIVKGLTGQLPTSKPYPGYLLKYNPSAYDSNVEAVQKRLGIVSDGFFGNATRGAITRYQQSNGLTPDGIVGQITWTKLFN